LALLFSGHGSLAQVRVSSKWNNDSFTYKRKDGFSSLEIGLKGEIQVNDSDTDVTSISEGGYLKISQTTFGNKRSILMESGAGGSLNKSYYEGRKEKEFDDDAKKWLSEVLIRVIHTTGIAAESRVNKFYKKGGTEAVLEEIKKIESSSGKGKYFEALLSLPNVKNVPLIAEKIGTYISSSSRKGALYRKYSERFMKDEATAKAMFRGINKISSNSERGSLLRHIIDNHSLSEAHYEGIFEVLRGVSSNSERGSVLRAINHNLPVNASIIDSYGSVVNSMSSNSERGSVLRSLVKKHPNPAVIKMSLNSLLRLSSDSEKGSVLRTVAPYVKDSDELFEAYLQVTGRMGSSSEIGSVLTTLIKNGQTNTVNSKVMFFESTRHITSNSERGNVLRKSVGFIDGDSQVNTAFFNSFKGLTSNSEQGSVLRTLISKPKLDKATMLGILDATRSMTSNSELGSVLVSLSRVMPKGDQEIREAYKSAASRLSSDSEYRRVINALD